MRVRLAAAGLAVVMTAGCSTAETTAPGYALRWTLTPAPPVVGDARLEFRVVDRDGASVPVTMARIEGHMTHPGMAPVTATAAEVSPDTYEARFAFTMRGDWTLLVEGQLPDGQPLRRRIDVANVRARE